MLIGKNHRVFVETSAEQIKGKLKGGPILGGKRGGERSIFGPMPIECEESSERRRRRSSECWPFINRERICQRVRKVSVDEGDKKSERKVRENRHVTVLMLNSVTGLF